MRKTIFCGFMLLLLLFVIGCQTPGTSTSKEKVKIGWIGPLTGQSAVLGIDSVVAAQIGIEEINGQGGINGNPVNLVIEDDQYDIKKTFNAYHKLVHNDGVKVILIHTYGAVFALAEQAEKDGVLLFDPLDCNEVLAELSDHVFCLATDSESIGEVLATSVSDREIEKMGIVYRNSDTFMPLVKDYVLENYFGETFVYAYEGKTNDFRTILSKLIEEKVEGIVLLGYDETGIAMKQARQLGFEGNFYTTGTVTSPSLQEAAGEAVEGVTLAFWEAPEKNIVRAGFDEAFYEKQGREPILDLATYPSYDSVKVLGEAMLLVDYGTVDSLREGILSVEMEGATGTVEFEKDGSMKIGEEAYVLENGKLKKKN